MRITAEDKEKLMTRIVEVAEKHVSQQGLSGLNLRGLAGEVGMKTGTLYNHFKGGLDEVILMVNSRTIAMLDEELRATAEKYADAEVSELFYHLADAYLVFSGNHARRFYALFEHQMDAPLPEWHLLEHHTLFRHVAAPLSRLLPDLSWEELAVLARTVYSAVHGIVHMSRQDRLTQLPLDVIRKQLWIVTKALADGLPGAIRSRHDDRD